MRDEAGADTASVLFERRGRLGLITLNRPEAINALTHEMVKAITARLEEWAAEPEVQTIVLTGAGDRGLCAGGDVISIYRDARSQGRATLDFWRDEYALNAAIARYPKPFVSIMDGIVLGGGIGLAAHASHRVVTERSALGLPETTIGFVPDVGGTWLLSRAPGELGTHLALTAGTADGADAIAIGFADHYVPRHDLPTLLEALETLPADEAIAAVAIASPASGLLRQQEWVDAAYSGDDVGTILNRLEAAGTPAAEKAAESIWRKSPTALLVTLAALRRARDLPDLESALEQEFRVSARTLGWADLVEGIRAQMIDKDRQPHWQPATLDEVDPATVAAAFEPLEQELRLPGRIDSTHREEGHQ